MISSMGSLLRKAIVPVRGQSYTTTIVRVCSILNSGEEKLKVAVGHCPWLYTGKLVVQNDVEEGTVNMQAVVVVNEAELPEFIHKETDSRPRCADHFGERFLADLRHDRLGLG